LGDLQGQHLLCFTFFSFPSLEPEITDKNIKNYHIQGKFENVCICPEKGPEKTLSFCLMLIIDRERQTHQAKRQ
jgi:hypothetical protein